MYSVSVRRITAVIWLGASVACSTLPERPPDLADSHHWPSQDLQAFTVVQPPGTEVTGVHLLQEATAAGALIVANTIRVADNTLAIVGGRNLSSAYFGANPEASYRGIDVLLARPVVADLSDSFDTFWNSTWAVPLDVLSKPDGTGVITEQSLRSLDAKSDNLRSQLNKQVWSQRHERQQEV